MIVAKELAEFNKYRDLISADKSIGFVPTMGALHQGHISLVEQSKKHSDITIVSIFVNPTQFNNQNDLKNYPRTLEEDCILLEKSGVDIVFAPTVEDIYPVPDNRLFNFNGLDAFGEGPRRPGHFNGVAQVVTRLFDIVKPTEAYFGEKDFQQVAIVKYFTKELGYKINIVDCPILREADGLAKSSRNMLLTPEQREASPLIYKALQRAESLMAQFSPAEVVRQITAEINSNSLLEVEYIEIIDSNKLVPIDNWSDAEELRIWCAVFAHPVRLIDNVKIK